jgi:hypothetical protein
LPEGKSRLRTGLGWQALRLHPAVRGAGVDARPTDAFAAVARIVGETWHRVRAICARHVDLALERADLSAVDAVAIDETSYERGQLTAIGRFTSGRMAARTVSAGTFAQVKPSRRSHHREMAEVAPVDTPRR